MNKIIDSLVESNPTKMAKLQVLGNFFTIKKVSSRRKQNLNFLIVFIRYLWCIWKYFLFYIVFANFFIYLHTKLPW